MEKFRLTAVGTTPLLMHNARLADPLDEVTKALKRVTSKRKKTEADHLEIARIEHMGGLYIDPDVGPHLPGENFQRCLLDAAKITRAGKQIERGVFIDTDVNPVAYEGPRDIEGLWADEGFRLKKSVKVSTSRTMRTRPMFRDWRCAAEGLYDPNIIGLDEVDAIATTAGLMIGLGDWRPRYGRFEALVEAL